MEETIQILEPIITKDPNDPKELKLGWITKEEIGDVQIDPSITFIQDEEVLVPTWEIVANYTVNISDIKKQKFEVIEAGVAEVMSSGYIFAPYMPLYETSAIKLDDIKSRRFYLTDKTPVDIPCEWYDFDYRHRNENLDLD